MQDTVQTLGQEVGRRDAVWDPGVADLALGPDQALGQRRFRDEERPGDLRRGQAAQRPKGQGDAGVHRESRVAAREDEAQAIVRDVHGVLRRARIDCLELRLDRRLAPQRLGLVDKALAPA